MAAWPRAIASSGWCVGMVGCELSAAMPVRIEVDFDLLLSIDLHVEASLESGDA